MSVISYMGTKSALVDPINRLIEIAKDGPLLDVFAGMSAVGSSQKDGRNVWLNDAQSFSKVVSRFQFCDILNKNEVIDSINCLILPKFVVHKEMLLKHYQWWIQRERSAISSRLPEKLWRCDNALRKSYESGGIRKSRISGVFDLFSRTHSGTYFSLEQAIEIDSIRYCIDQISEPASDVENLFLAALGRAMVKCSNSTGHFAQYLTYKPKIAQRFLLQRSKSIWNEWNRALPYMQQVGSDCWRRKNRVFNEDANTLLKKMTTWAQRPSVIYADPPYTDDQYSRFYHVLDTMVLYDFPQTEGKGQYRQERFRSNFSLRSMIQEEFEILIKYSANTGADLIISYPTNGLLENSSEKIPRMLAKHFKNVHPTTIVDHKHSTLGASKGLDRHFVSEQIFLAQN